MTIYFQPTGSQDAPQPFDYARLIRADFGPEIITRKSPSRGTFWILEDANAEPADSPLYTVTSSIVFHADQFNAHYPHFKRAVRTWTRTRRPIEEINAMLDAREEAKELELLKRAVARLVRADDVVLNVLLALVNASTLGANAKQSARDAINARLTVNDAMRDAIQALQNETTTLKQQAAAGEDVEVTP